MQLTHFGHSCLLAQTDTTRLLFDPGTLANGYDSLTDLTAVLVTHQHADHLDLARLPQLLAANPQAELIVDAGSAPLLAELDFPVRVIEPGTTVRLGGEQVAAVGGTHAVIHADVPVIPNVGYVIADGAFYHPGDSLYVPAQEVDVLAVPASGPWMKIGEGIDFLRAVAPRAAVPIHEATLANPGLHLSLLTNLALPQTEVSVLPAGDAVTC